jgi:hypothetical protein
MTPGAAVSGYYFSHPELPYFGVAEIGRGPGAGLTPKRKGMDAEEAGEMALPEPLLRP